MIDANTDLYCIFGNPAKHSKSPLIHNALFKHHCINASYLAFEIENIKAGVDALKTLNIKGASITIPFKESVMDYLDIISPDAKAMWAVNTIVNQDNKLYGYNTDCMAAISPLKSFGIKDKTCLIIGAGGAAQAVAYGIKKEGGKLIIVNRSVEKGEKLAQKFDADFVPLNEFKKHALKFDQSKSMGELKTDIIINTTSIGMHPHVEETPMPSNFFDPSMIVMDVVYTPIETKLLREAKQKGCNVIDGLSMFLHQGAQQFKLWTDISPDIEIMKQAIINGEKNH